MKNTIPKTGAKTAMSIIQVTLLSFLYCRLFPYAHYTTAYILLSKNFPLKNKLYVLEGIVSTISYRAAISRSPDIIFLYGTLCYPLNYEAYNANRTT